MTYGYVSEAQLYGGGMSAQAQQLSNVQYAQPVAYAEPRVQLVTVSQSGWGWSDLALLAVASGVVGAAAAVGFQSKASAEKKSVAPRTMQDFDEEIALATIATLAA